nr:DEAD/DEAH box helicase [Cytobacillus gottheilii]
MLLHDELPFPKEQLHEHYENGYIHYHKGISIEKGKPVCTRCGNSTRHHFAAFSCARCGEKECLYCRHCIMMGRVSSCTPLLSWAGPAAHLSGTAALKWDGTLSQGQAHASKKVTEAIQANGELLVWAVCGAGKTEVLFAGIAAALAQGKRVCIATPRTDVVLELSPRLQAVFPGIKVAALYGGSEERNENSVLTISTTHQLFRFHEAFDTIIIDEVDAFPFSADRSLQHAAQKARKNSSALISLSATPNEKWQNECKKGNRPFVTIPGRYHRHPLPVPEMKWCGDWEKTLKRGKLPLIVETWITKRLTEKTPALLFLPKIELMEVLLPYMKTFDERIEAVHAEDPQRKEKVQRMRNKETPLLVTTTILERGVTFPGVDVAVLGAEDRIFTESALVQIAGRAGRSSSQPNGNITFFHYGKTNAMNKAYRQITNMNKEAFEKGLIDYVLPGMRN